jgi:hypothetical protein
MILHGYTLARCDDEGKFILRSRRVETSFHFWMMDDFYKQAETNKQ